MRGDTFFRGVVAIMALYHVAFGILLNCPASALERALQLLYGATRKPEMAGSMYVANMLGAYMLAIGIALALAAWNPVKNRAILTVGAILVALRAIHRIAFAGTMVDLLGVTPGRNWAMIVIQLAFSIALISFRLRLLRDTEPRTGA